MAETKKRKTPAQAAAAEDAAPKRSTRAKAPAATHAGEPEAKPRAAAARKAAPRRRKAVAFDPMLHQEEIAREAYLMWLSRGAAHGCDEEDWYKAEEIVRSRYGAAR